MSNVNTLVFELVKLFSIFLILITIWVGWPKIIGAQWIPTPMKTVKQMLNFAEVGPDDTVIDLGSGDGRIILSAALEFKANAVGIEADPLRVFFTRLKIRLKQIENQVDVIWGDFFKKDLNTATVVTIYQSTETNNRLKDKLTQELIPGTRVISYVFLFDGWEPVKVDKLSKLYLYEI
jgi:phospholipid N-methyltransferase